MDTKRESAVEGVNASGCLVLFVALFIALSGIKTVFFADDPGDVRLSVSVSPSVPGSRESEGEETGAPTKEEDTGLLVDGRAFYRARPVADGTVHLEVVRIAPRPVELSYFIEISKDGTFSKDLVGFGEDDEVLVTATAELPPATSSTDEASALPRGTAEATWNYNALDAWLRTWGSKLAIIAILTLAIALAVLFTGGYSPRKSRVTFMVIYLMAGFALVLPFLALYYAEAITDPDRMASLPVGILEVGKVGASEVELNQWALNIGGTVTPSTASAEGVAPTIENGLVVPLYVLVLAILGGAVNLLRKVPKLQNDINDRFDVPSLQLGWTAMRGFFRSVGREARRAVSFFKSNAAEGTEDVRDLDDDGQRADEDDLQEEDDLRRRLSKLTEDQRLRLDELKQKRRKEERARHRLNRLRQLELNERRGQLIRQVLFLITAPFLGIVGYYGLMLIEPTLGGRTPFIVLFAFSIGLATEGFLDALTDWFDKMLGKLKTGARTGEAAAIRSGGDEGRDESSTQES